MFVADGVQGLAGAKQPKYYGKSYLRLCLGICVILLSIGALTYSIVINALGPQVRVERATYSCDDGEISWDDFDSCECSSEVLYRDMFGATQDEAFENNRILTYYFLPYDLIGIYPPEYQSNLSFVSDFLLDYDKVNYGGKEYCEVVPFKNFEDPTPCLACSENPQTVPFNKSVLTCYDGSDSVWAENEAYRNMCVQDFEIYMDNIGGEARLFTYLSEAYYSWDAAMSQLVPPRTQFRWLRQLPYGAPSLLFRDAMMAAATRAGRSPLIAPKTAWIRQNMFYRGVFFLFFFFYLFFFF